MAPIRGLVLTWTDDAVVSQENYDLGVTGLSNVEPFDLLGVPQGTSSVEPFWLEGVAQATSVEPFYFGEKAGRSSVEPFDLLGATDVPEMVLPTTGAPAVLPYGWWLPEDDAYEDLGDVVTD